MTLIAAADARGIARAAELLRAGELVAFPTETVYGLGADARSDAAVRKIFAAKGRPANHPVIVHLREAHDVHAWAAAWPSAAQKLAAAFWPGPLTVIVRRAAGVHDVVTGGQDTVGLRVPVHPVAQALLQAFGDGIAAPSANRFGLISPTAAHRLRAPDANIIGTTASAQTSIAVLRAPLTDHPRLISADDSQPPPMLPMSAIR